MPNKPFYTMDAGTPQHGGVGTLDFRIYGLSADSQPVIYFPKPCYIEAEHWSDIVCPDFIDGCFFFRTDCRLPEYGEHPINLRLLYYSSNQWNHLGTEGCRLSVPYPADGVRKKVTITAGPNALVDMHDLESMLNGADEIAIDASGRNALVRLCNDYDRNAGKPDEQTKCYYFFPLAGERQNCLPICLSPSRPVAKRWYLEMPDGKRIYVFTEPTIEFGRCGKHVTFPIEGQEIKDGTKESGFDNLSKSHASLAFIDGNASITNLSKLRELSYDGDTIKCGESRREPISSDKPFKLNFSEDVLEMEITPHQYNTDNLFLSDWLQKTSLSKDVLWRLCGERYATQPTSKMSALQFSYTDINKERNPYYGTREYYLVSSCARFSLSNDCTVAIFVLNGRCWLVPLSEGALRYCWDESDWTKESAPLCQHQPLALRDSISLRKPDGNVVATIQEVRDVT